MEEDDSDSDRTVLLTEFVDKPQKIDAKRRRLSQLQDRSKQEHQDDDNTAQNDVSQNIQTDLPKNNIEKDWLITKYLSGIANVCNTSDFRENAPKYAPDSQTYAGNTENTAKFANDSDIICLDSDDEMKSHEKCQNQYTNNGEISSVNDSLHATKLKVLKPAAINARRATTSIVESHKMHSNASVSQTQKENKPARLNVLRPSAINARRATTHFGESNLECNSNNGKSNVSKNDKMKSGNNEQADTDCYRFISPRLCPLESSIPNTTSITSSVTNNVTGKCVVTQSENSLTSILTVPNNKLNTDISDSAIITNKDFQQDIEDSNVKANKRFGNNETQIEPKRIKINLKPKCLVKQHEDTGQITNKQSKASELCDEIRNEEHVSHDKATYTTTSVRREKCDGHNENKASLENNLRNDNEVLTAKTCNKVCEADTTPKENILPAKENNCNVDEQVINEGRTKLQILSKPLDKQDENNAKKYPGISQVPDEQKTSDPCDKHDTSKRDAKKRVDKVKTSEISVDTTHDSVAASKIQIQQNSHDHETSINQDETITKEYQRKQNSSYALDKTIGIKQKTSEAITEPETYKDPDLASEVLNTECTSKILEKTILSTTNEAQESTQVQYELETSKVQNKQITSQACDNQETNKLYDQQRTIETLNAEVVRKLQNKIVMSTVSEQEARKVSSEQGTDQRNKTPTEVTPNYGAENNKRVLKFQIIFLKYILENIIKKRYPESESTLNNIIKTLLINARNGTYQTHVQYACPECGCLSNYSSSLLNNTKAGVNKVTKDGSQNCGLCRGVRDIHTAYLKKISNKKDHTRNKKEDVDSISAEKDHAKQVVGQSDKSLTQETSSHSKTIFQENYNDDSISMSVVEDRSVSLAVDKEKESDNVSSTQSALEAQTGNHNVSKEHKINSETPFIETPETENQGKNKITSRNMNEIVTINDKLAITNKRTNEIDDQSIIHKRMKTVTESNKTQSEKNRKTKDNSSYLTTDFQSDNRAIENKKKMDQATPRNSNSAVELPKSILSDILNVTSSIESSHENNKTSCSKRDNSSNLVSPVVVVSKSDAELNRDVLSVQHDSSIAEKASSESPAETHMITINLNTQEKSLKSNSHGDNHIIAAETDQLKKKSDNNSNEVANEKPRDATTQKVSSVEVEENDKRIENSCYKSAMAEAQIRNTDEVHKHHESIKSLVENPQLNKNAEEEKGSQDLASKESLSSDKLISGATIAIKYICPICTSTYTHPSKFLRHLKDKYNVRLTKIPENCIRQQCPFCNSLLFKKSYNKHVSRCSSDTHENTNVNKEKNKNERCSNANNEQIKTTESISSVCDETLTTDYAAARHRTRLHPELKHRHIIKKLRLGNKNNYEQEEKQNDDNENTVANNIDNSNTICGSVDGASETITTTAIASQTTTNSRKKRKPSINRDMSEDEESCDSDESSSYSDNSYKTSETSDDEDDDERDKNKTKTFTTSGEGTSTDKNAHSTSKRQNYTFICELCNQMLYTDYATRKHRIHQHPNMKGRPIFKKIKNVEPKANALKSKKERKKLLEDNRSPSSINNSKARKNCKDDKDENTSDSDWSTINDSDCFDERSSFENTETASEDDIINASDNLAKKRKKRTTKFFGAKRRSSRATAIKENAEIEESDSDWIVSTDDCNSQNAIDDEMEEDSDSQKTDIEESNDDSNSSMDDEDPPVSDSETLNTSMRTIKKRKVRLLKLFGDSNNIDENDGDQQVTSEENDNEPITDHIHEDNQCHIKESALRNFREEMPSDDETINVSENTLKKRKERMSTLFDDAIEISAQNTDDNEQERSNKTNNSTDNIIPVVGKSGSVQIEMNKNYRPDLKTGENYHETLNVSDHQVQNKETHCNTNYEDCHMNPAIQSTNTTEVSKDNHASVLSNVKVVDDDRREIDLIDGLLQEYNTPNDQRNYSCAEKEKDGEDDREPDSHNAQAEVNIVNQSEINNCLENIQITNIRSIANKLYIFICQECSYGTDTYDDTIRHCQNHYNQIEDPVTYCNICQMNYDSSCFERHGISHDRYLINIKIKFSYHWLFSNWQAVFANNHILLSDAEEMQVQSVYKTMCVKMTVTEDGPWQSTLYLCAKCNIFVPPLDIEMHVQQKCTLKYYPCPICHRVFLTHEMREHHKIYHTDEITQPFKTIVFNEKKNEHSNSKLIQIKLQLTQNKEKKRNVEIYKCICGLCFITLKQFKLHFVDCESETNNGVQCTICPGLRRFLPSDLEIHMALHHSAIKYEFRIQQITFQEERDYESSEPSFALGTTSDINDEDLNVKREMLKDETLSQENRNIVEEDSEILSSLENAVQQMTIDADSNINREVAKDELLSQNTSYNIDIIEENLNTKSIADNSALVMSIADDDNNKRDLLKNELLSQNSNKENSRKALDITEKDLVNKSASDIATPVRSNDADLNIKREMLKDEVSSQNTFEEDIQEYTKVFEEHVKTSGSEQIMPIDKDLSIKKELLKYESFSQTTNEENSQNSQDILEEDLVKKSATDDAAQINSNDEDLITKRDMLKGQTLQNIIEEDTQENTEMCEEPLQKRDSTLILLVVRDHNIKGDVLKKESTPKNTNKDNQNSPHIEEMVNQIENATQTMSSNDDLNVPSRTLRSQVNNEEKRLNSENPVEKNFDIERETSKVVETEDTIIIEDSDDDDVELVGEDVNDHRFLRHRAYPDNGKHWELIL